MEYGDVITTITLKADAVTVKAVRVLAKRHGGNRSEAIRAAILQAAEAAQKPATHGPKGVAA